jgi:hypothetical protein
MKKVTYSTPVLRAHGKVEAVTKGGVNGNFTDAAFPAGTPFAAITFS